MSTWATHHVHIIVPVEVIGPSVERIPEVISVLPTLSQMSVCLLIDDVGDRSPVGLCSLRSI